MSQRQSRSQPTARDAKRARFAGKQQPKKTKGASFLVLVAGVVVVLALIGGTVFALTRSTAKAASANPPSSGSQAANAGSQAVAVKAATLGHDPYPLITAENGAVHLPASAFDDGKARFYTFMQDGRPVEFFVVKDKNGVLRVAFNACDVCYPAKKGYHQEGDEMVCNNCGSRFPAVQIGLIRGGCNPAPLAHTVQGSTLVIQVTDLAAGLSYF